MRSHSTAAWSGRMLRAMPRRMVLGLVAWLGCATAVVAEPVASPAVVEAAIVRARHEVIADDGHAITVWSKRPAQIRGAIVLVHGRTWSAVPDFDLDGHSTMDALVARGYAAYAVDLRGYGGTPRDASGWITPARAADDLAAVVAFVRADADRTPVLLGWSMGSLVAQLVAQRAPESIDALVLYGYPRDPAHPAPPRDEPGGAPPRARNTAEAAASDFIMPEAIDRATIDAYVAAALAADPVRADWRELAGFAELDPTKVTVPTLVIHGERDPYAPITNQAKLFGRLATPDRAWVVLPRSDHAAHLERAGPAFVHAVVGFLEQPR